MPEIGKLSDTLFKNPTCKKGKIPQSSSKITDDF